MEADGESVLPDPARKISSVVREEGDRYRPIMSQEIIQDRTYRPRHHR
jgi:hypothetical protein